MASTAILIFSNSQDLLADGPTRPRCITVPNFIKIGRPVARLQRYWYISIFQDGGHPPFFICLGHIWTTHGGYLVVFITLQNLFAIDAVVSKI